MKNTDLSNVSDTIFHVDDRKSPHSRNLVFHNRHFMDPKIPLLCIKYASLTVTVTRSSRLDAEKSKIL